ncbi:MAG: hypothetical protein U1F30_10145 [Steroidobacteraceae bacterium]
MLASLNNTAFIGLPLLGDALRGGAAVSLGLLADQLGFFLALTIGGAVVGAAYSGERADAAAIARKVLLYRRSSPRSSTSPSGRSAAGRRPYRRCCKVSQTLAAGAVLGGAAVAAAHGRQAWRGGADAGVFAADAGESCWPAATRSACRGCRSPSARCDRRCPRCSSR